MESVLKRFGLGRKRRPSALSFLVLPLAQSVLYLSLACVYIYMAGRVASLIEGEIEKLVWVLIVALGGLSVTITMLLVGRRR
jgi:hypothetical protein